VEGVEIDEESGRITRIIVRRGLLSPRRRPFRRLIASVGDDEVKKLQRVLADQLGTAPAR
jgi:hypothetical protein